MRDAELIHPACGDRVAAEPMSLARHILVCRLATDEERRVAHQCLDEVKALDPAYQKDSRQTRHKGPAMSP